MIQKKYSSLWVWVLCAILIVVQLVQFGFNYARTAALKTSQDVVSNFLLLLFALICAVIGSLIISRQPRNTIGWLLITIPVSFSILLPFQLTFTIARRGSEPGFSTHTVGRLAG